MEEALKLLRTAAISLGVSRIAVQANGDVVIEKAYAAPKVQDIMTAARYLDDAIQMAKLNGPGPDAGG